MSGIGLKYKKKRRELGEYWLYKYAMLRGQDLLLQLQKDKLLNPAMDVTRMDARWTKSNTVEIWYDNARLSGQIRFDKKPRYETEAANVG